jgi:hypothetical protein
MEWAIERRRLFSPPRPHPPQYHHVGAPFIDKPRGPPSIRSPPAEHNSILRPLVDTEHFRITEAKATAPASLVRQRQPRRPCRRHRQGKPSVLVGRAVGGLALTEPKPLPAAAQLERSRRGDVVKNARDGVVTGQTDRQREATGQCAWSMLQGVRERLRSPLARAAQMPICRRTLGR